MELKGDTRLRSDTALGLDAWDSATDFKIVEVIEISGAGKVLK